MIKRFDAQLALGISNVPMQERYKKLHVYPGKDWTAYGRKYGQWVGTMNQVTRAGTKP